MIQMGIGQIYGYVAEQFFISEFELKEPAVATCIQSIFSSASLAEICRLKGLDNVSVIQSASSSRYFEVCDLTCSFVVGLNVMEHAHI